MAFALFRVGAEQIFGNDQPQNPIAEEFQPLIVALVLDGAGMGQRRAQEVLIHETITDFSRNRLEPRRRDACHQRQIKLKKRLQRSAKGSATHQTGWLPAIPRRI